MIDLKSRRVLVIGLGATGRSAARFLSDRGAKLVLCDQRRDIDAAGLPRGTAIHLGAEDPAWLDRIDLVIPSPGVPRDNTLLLEAVARDIPILAELELASRFINAPMVAITGTNGKSTVTTIVGDILERAGMRPFVGGNLGSPLIDAVGSAYGVMVVEVSSFQLEWVENFRPHVAVHLNLSDDHLYRYRDFEEYGACKARLFQNQDSSDWAVLNRDDPSVRRLASTVRSKVISFGLSAPARAPAVWLDGQRMMIEVESVHSHIELAEAKLVGRHNLSNAMAAAAAAMAAGAAQPAIEAGLSGFRGLPHRIAIVRELNGVTFVDDSKGTNVGAVEVALAAVSPPIILIAGGMDKGGDYSPLREPLRRRVKLALLIGEAREKMRRALEGATQIELVPELNGAVTRAWSAAAPGDTVLLSPACSSFDQFKDYAERGRVFEELVRAL